MNRIGTTSTATNVGTTRELDAVRAQADGTVWAAGQGGAVFHYDGTAWHDRSFAGFDILSVWVSGPNDVWVAGTGTQAAHWTGTWQQTPLPESGWMSSLWSNTAGILYAFNGKHLLKWDGSQWSIVPNSRLFPDWQINSMSHVFDQIKATWFSPNDVWTASSYGHQAYHWNGTSWSAVALPANEDDGPYGIVAPPSGKKIVAIGPDRMLRSFMR